MNFTIEEINEAWLEYSKPRWMVSSGVVTTDKNGKPIDISNAVTEVSKQQDFISWLIQWKTKSK